MTVPLYRRFGALLYDALLILSLWILASWPYLYYFHQTLNTPLGLWGYRLFLWGIGFLFMGFFWVKSGQTVGMKAWKLVLRQHGSHQPITWPQAFWRYCLATLSLGLGGVGYLVAFFRHDRQTCHDLLSKTILAQSI